MFRRRRTSSDFAAEVRSHIALETDRLIAEGVSPEDARAAATRRFGNVTTAEERFYESRRILWVDHLLQDLRYTVRGLGKNRTFTAVAIVTLALGIGANTAIFSVLKAVLLEPLPFRDPDQLVQLIQTLPADRTIDGRSRRIVAMDLEEFSELRKNTRSFASLAAYDTSREVTLEGREEPLRLVGTAISASLFPALGIQPRLGRNFLPEEERPGSQILILSSGTWQKYFGSDPEILKRTLIVDGRSYSVAGVMPQGFEFPDRFTEFWTPLNLTPPARGDIRSIIPIGRLQTDVTAAAATSESNTILENFRRAYPPERAITWAPLELIKVKDELVRPVQSALIVLTIAVVFVLLIACSNVANLLLARGAARQGEHALRVALGAGPGRLIRQMLTESCLLALMGGAAGCVIAFGGVRLLKNLAGNTVPRLDGIGIDFTVLAFTFALSAITGVLFGLFPALQWSRTDHMEVIKATVGTKSSGRHRTRGLIVVAEVGMAVVLLIGGALLIRSFLKLSQVDPGFDPRNVLMFQVAMPQPLNRAAINENVTQELLSRLQSVPGVKSAAFANAVPLVPGSSFLHPRIMGMPVPLSGQPEFRQVSRDYLSAMGMRLIAGRGFGENDGPTQARVVIVNRAMVPYFAGSSPIGKTITLAGNSAEIIGIIDDTHEQALNLEPRPQVYIDSRQSLEIYRNAQALNWAYFVIRFEVDPIPMIPTVRRILRETIPGATLKLNATSMEQVVYSSIARPRLYAILLGIFGTVAVLLAMIGVYGITTYSVAQRTREIGIRIALGAARRAVLGLAISRTLVLSTIGIVLGLAAAAALTRYLEGMLFGLRPLDAITFVAVAVAFEITAVLASYLPARRAAKVDPLIALRQE
jgi:putative ABC transport system permease protein